MFCGIDNISQNIPPTHQYNMRIFYGILSVPQNIVMDLYNVMKSPTSRRLVLLETPSFMTNEFT